MTCHAKYLCWAACLAVLLGGVAGQAAKPLPIVRVSDNGRYFVKSDGTPFFWLGDTAWGIFNHATPSDVDVYLDDRASKGFTVIQGCLVLWDGLRHANPDGQLPFVNGDPAQINEAYFKNADSIIEKAAQRGLYMAILPVWTKGNTGPRSADTLADPAKMQRYCEFLGKRYGGKRIFWVLGGDSPGQGIEPLIDAEAAGLRQGAQEAGQDKILITYHPTGRQSSSFWFQNRPWLSFNAIQSGHFINTTNFQIVGDDWAKTPVKPTLDMEPGYENITDRLVRNDPTARRIQAVDVRRSAYLAVFAGAAGHTYGNGEVYSFWTPGAGEGTMPGWSSGMPWREALKLPGSSQVQFLRYLIESRPTQERIPDQSLIVGDGAANTADRIAACRGADGSYAFVYVPADRDGVTVQTGALTGKVLVAWWYDPITGRATRLGTVPASPTRDFSAPEVNGTDWVLVLDDAARHYAAPGGHARPRK